MKNMKSYKIFNKKKFRRKIYSKEMQQISNQTNIYISSVVAAAAAAAAVECSIQHSTPNYFR